MIRLSILATLMLVTLTANGMAQSVAIELNPAQQTQIKEYVSKQRVPVAEIKQTIAIGSAVPTEVELRAVPAGWGPTVSKFRFFHGEKRIYFVDPSTRRVVRIVE